MDSVSAGVPCQEISRKRPLAALVPDLSLRGAKRRSNLALRGNKKIEIASSQRTLLSMNRNPKVGWIKRSGSTILTIVHRLSSAAWWIRFFVAAFVFVPCLIHPTIANRVHGSWAVLAAPT